MKNSIVHVEEIGEITVIRVTENKLYQNVVAPFREQMVSLVEKGKRNFIVNLSMVDLMNSSGLGVLILMWDRLNQEGGNLVITGLCPLMEELFNRMRLDTYFTITKTEEDALGLIRGDKKIPAT
jgi:anti-anti-sigma factor